jgi:hypothetical protein
MQLTASGAVPYGISAGAAEEGMARVCIMNPGFWSSFNNQASLAFNNSLLIGFNYENRFGIMELGTRTAGILIPAGKASLGAAYSHFGYTDFKRDMAGLACGLKITDKISAGVQIDYYSERTSGEYSNNKFISFETGVIFSPADNIRVGVHLFNPVPNSLRKTGLPMTIRVGAGTDLNKALFAGAEVEMSSGKKLIIRSGFEYIMAKSLSLRAGYCTNNNSFSFGTGYILKMVQLDLGFSTHDRLGVTSSVSMIFKIH